MGNANVGSKDFLIKHKLLIQSLSEFPFEIQSNIWTMVIFENLDLSEILSLLGIHDDLDYIIFSYFSSNFFVISRYMNLKTHLKISGVLGKILINSIEFESLLNLLLSRKIDIQRLVFEREIHEIIHLNENIGILLYHTTNICFVFYQQLIELQNWKLEFLSKIEYLSISASDDITELKFDELRNLTHVVLNIYEYPPNIKYISKIVSYLLKLKKLEYLNIKLIIEKEFELPYCLVDTLNKLTIKHVHSSVEVLDNDLTIKNMNFNWIDERLNPIGQYITDFKMTLDSKSTIDFQNLNQYVRLETLKISVNYSLNKSGFFKMKSRRLKCLELSYFDKKLKYSVKRLKNLEKLIIIASDINTKIIDEFPRKLNELKILDCWFDTDTIFNLPKNLKIFEYSASTRVNHFPIIHNIEELTNLQQLKLELLDLLPQNFIDKIPNNVKNMSINIESFKNGINWNLMNFSNLKSLSKFQVIGNVIEYDLFLLPRNIDYLNFKLNFLILKNKLPFQLKKLDISFQSSQSSLCSTLNNIKENSRYLEHLIIRSAKSNLDLIRLKYQNIKIIKLFINHGLLNSKTIIKIGTLPQSLIKFQITSNKTETILMAPRKEIEQNNLNKIGILNGISQLKQNEIPKINLEVGISKLKIDNVGNKMKKENNKTKLKIKGILKRK